MQRWHNIWFWKTNILKRYLIINCQTSSWVITFLISLSLFSLSALSIASRSDRSISILVCMKFPLFCVFLFFLFHLLMVQLAVQILFISLLFSVVALCILSTHPYFAAFFLFCLKRMQISILFFGTNDSGFNSII